MEFVCNLNSAVATDAFSSPGRHDNLRLEKVCLGCYSTLCAIAFAV